MRWKLMINGHEYMPPNIMEICSDDDKQEDILSYTYENGIYNFKILSPSKKTLDLAERRALKLAVNRRHSHRCFSTHKKEINRYLSRHDNYTAQYFPFSDDLTLILREDQISIPITVLNYAKYMTEKAPYFLKYYFLLCDSDNRCYRTYKKTDKIHEKIFYFSDYTTEAPQWARWRAEHTWRNSDISNLGTVKFSFFLQNLRPTNLYDLSKVTFEKQDGFSKIESVEVTERYKIEVTFKIIKSLLDVPKGYTEEYFDIYYEQKHLQNLRIRYYIYTDSNSAIIVID